MVHGDAFLCFVVSHPKSAAFGNFSSHSQLRLCNPNTQQDEVFDDKENDDRRNEYTDDVGSYYT